MALLSVKVAVKLWIRLIIGVIQKLLDSHFSTPSLSCNVHILRADSLNVEKLKYITAIYFSRDISGYLSFFYKVDDSNIFEYCSLQ